MRQPGGDQCRDSLPSAIAATPKMSSILAVISKTPSAALVCSPQRFRFQNRQIGIERLHMSARLL
jgi:hypothetical protein